MITQAVVLAGGEGNRIHPLGVSKPKSMYKIRGKPLIQHVCENLAHAGIRDIIVVTGPNDDAIRTHFGDGSELGIQLRYTQQVEPLGQANAILTAEGLIDSPFFVLNANDIFEESLLADVMALGDDPACDVVLVGREVDEPWRFGVMRFDADGALIGVIEKPPRGEEPSSIGVVGVYCFSPEIFRAIHSTPITETDDQLERAYQKLIDAGRGRYYAYQGLFESFKFPWNLLTIGDMLVANTVFGQHIGRDSRIAASATIGDNVFIAEGVRIFEHAVIRGPAYIGPGCVVGNNTLIWGGCSIGANCIIGFDTEIKHSILEDHVWTHRAYIGDSIIADNCSFGAGTITSNYRFDEGNVTVNIKDERVDTGTAKFGVIMAEGCRTGSNSVLMPGIKLGPNCVVGPGVALFDDLLPSDKIAMPVRNAYTVRDNPNRLSTTRDQLRNKMLGKT